MTRAGEPVAPGDPSEVSPDERIGNRRLALLDLGSAGNSAARSVASALIGSLMASLFDASARSVGLVLALNGIAGLVVPPLVGRLSDGTSSRWGRRRPFILVLSVVFALSLAVLPFAAAFGPFVALVALVFVGVVGAQTAYQALLVDVLPPRELERGFATAAAMSGAGGAVGLLAGGWLFELGRSWPFLAVASFALAAVALSLKSFHEPHELVEQQAGERVAWRRIARHRSFAWLLAGQVLWWLALGALTPFFVLYARRVLRLEPGPAATILVAIGIVGLGVAGLLAKLKLDGDRRRIALLGGLALMVAGFVTAYVAGSALLPALGGVALVALGAGVIAVVPGAIVGSIAPESAHGAYQGISTVSKALGQAVAPPLAGFLISGPAGGDYRAMLLLAAGAALLAVVPVVLMGRPEPFEEEPFAQGPFEERPFEDGPGERGPSPGP